MYSKSINDSVCGGNCRVADDLLSRHIYIWHADSPRIEQIQDFNDLNVSREV